ncbi:MAG: hypothetical protein U1F43_31270 [Myxococcota bacterium]
MMPGLTRAWRTCADSAPQNPHEVPHTRVENAARFPRAPWKTLRVFHITHSPDDDGKLDIVLFVLFCLSFGDCIGLAILAISPHVH